MIRRSCRIPIPGPLADATQRRQGRRRAAERGNGLARDPLLSQELAGDAAPLGDAVRAQWSIENSVH